MRNKILQSGIQKIKFRNESRFDVIKNTLMDFKLLTQVIFLHCNLTHLWIHRMNLLAEIIYF